MKNAITIEQILAVTDRLEIGLISLNSAKNQIDLILTELLEPKSTSTPVNNEELIPFSFGDYEQFIDRYIIPTNGDKYICKIIGCTDTGVLLGQIFISYEELFNEYVFDNGNNNHSKCGKKP